MPNPLTVIVALGDVAVKVYHTSFVGVVAPAQMALGEPVLVAASKSPGIVEHVVDGERVTALLQASLDAWEKTIVGKLKNNKAAIRIRTLDLALIAWIWLFWISSYCPYFNKQQAAKILGVFI